ncbi:MAG: DsbA family protein [Alphaproteobacteria bacterium]|nr:DsbA family protein [Alphaproteobacteria bacterium]
MPLDRVRASERRLLKPFRAPLLLVLSALIAAAVAYGIVRWERPPEFSEDRIRQYLLQHPEVVIDAVRAFQEQGQRQVALQREQALRQWRTALVQDPQTPVAGNPDGDVSVVEFFDYTCSYCRQAHPTVTQLLREDPGIRLVLKEYPILSQRAVLASRIALALHRLAPDRYVAFHDALYGVRGSLDEATILRLAAETGVDIEALTRIAESDEIGAILEGNAQLASAIGVDGTPAFVIGDELVPGSVDLATFRRLVAKTRERCRTC